MVGVRDAGGGRRTKKGAGSPLPFSGGGHVSLHEKRCPPIRFCGNGKMGGSRQRGEELRGKEKLRGSGGSKEPSSVLVDYKTGAREEEKRWQKYKKERKRKGLAMEGENEPPGR